MLKEKCMSKTILIAGTDFKPNAELAKFHLVSSLEIKRFERIVEHLITTDRQLKRRIGLASGLVSIMNAATEVIALIVELEDLWILHQQRESARHQLRSVPNKIIEDLTVLLRECKKETLHS